MKTTNKPKNKITVTAVEDDFMITVIFKRETKKQPSSPDAYDSKYEMFYSSDSDELIESEEYSDEYSDNSIFLKKKTSPIKQYTCKCGSTLNVNGAVRHSKTEKHINYLKTRKLFKRGKK